ncbi:hypothetical protein LTR08_006473 [Meristemomyces frigidus]|nr:hypothetical protein LTR08_006473 [Meristemomyces frigidus]
MHWLRVSTFAALWVGGYAAPPAQVPLRGDRSVLPGVNGVTAVAHQRPLHGRFLHVTDFHPDRFYKAYTSTTEDAACHHGHGPAGVYGAETSECDSPISLINETMAWIERELKDKIDFVVWTGDSARHDNDDELPRSTAQVVGLNEMMVQRMFDVFGKRNGDAEDEDPNNDYIIPIIPSLGNNDILPHNVMTAGPNAWTRAYANIWKQFIPEAQKHQFEQGGWFYVEVIPNKLAVFSLNTLYFFRSNAAVDGCASRHEPGHRQLEWLRIQLQFMRERGVKAMLTGHVPPIRQNAKTTWDETCWQKYTLWLRQYRDVVVSSHFGHFNYDHFMLQDFQDLDKATKHGRIEHYHDESLENCSNEDVHTAVSSDYFIQLRNGWSDLPTPPKSVNSVGAGSDNEMDVQDGMTATSARMLKNAKKHKETQREKRKKYLKDMGGAYDERFAVSFVSPSVVPNLFPAFRVFEYNITGMNYHRPEGGTIHPPPPQSTAAETEEDVTMLRRKKKKPKQFKFRVPEAPDKASPPGPAYSPQTLSLLKYTQYYANLTHINNDFVDVGTVAEDNLDIRKWKEGKHKGRKLRNKDSTPHPKKFAYQVHYDSQDDDIYKLKDLTVPSMIDLARRIGSFVAEDNVDLVSDAEDEQLEDGESREDVDVGTTKKKHKKKHGKSKHGLKHAKENAAWYAFVRRAYVETMDPEQIEEQFGH